VLFLCSFLLLQTAATPPPADRILQHGKIYTLDPAQPWVEAMAIRDGKIVFVGDHAGALPYRGPATETVALGGKMVMPGIGDSHMHLLEAHHPATGTVILESGQSLVNYIPTIQAQAQNQIGTHWVMGWGFSMFDVLLDEMFFARTPVSVLDSAVPNGPAAIMEETSHAIWVNSAALAAAGIDRHTPDPPGGVIMKNFWTGRPNGILIDAAGELVMDLAMAPNPALDTLNQRALKIGYRHAARNGITMIGEARAFWQRNYLSAYQQAQADGTMTAHTVLSLWAAPGANDTAQIATLTSMYGRNPQELLHTSQIKIYSDGITTMSTAAMLEPYQRLQLAAPDGLNYFDDSRLARYVRELEQIGFDMHIHAIGDRGVRESLDAIEAAQIANPGLPPRRHRITHVEMVEPTDVPRFAQLGVIADFQTSSQWVLEEHQFDLEPLLGHQRLLERWLPLRDIWDSGAHVVLSSDYDVGSLSPFVGMQNALNRGPQSLPTVDAAIRAYTIEPAYLLRLEQQTGSLEVGKDADYLVLDRNLFTIPSQSLGQTKVLQTVLQGNVVWQSPGF